MLCPYFVNFIAQPTEPLPHTHVDEVANIAAMIATPLAVGQSLYTRRDFLPYFEKRAMDIAQPNVASLSYIILQSLTKVNSRYHSAAELVNFVVLHPFQKHTMLLSLPGVQ
jgi:hypothetical protein